MSGETGSQFATQAELQEVAAQMATQADLKDQDLKLQGQILKLQGLMLDLNPGTPAPAPTRRLSGFRNAMDRHTLVACVWGAVVGAVGGAVVGLMIVRHDEIAAWGQEVGLRFFS